MNINELFQQDQLPSVPAVAMRILKLVDDPVASSADLATEIKNDAAMAAQILRLANSPAYCATREVTSVELAVSVLGRTTVASTALTFSLCQHAESDGELKDEFDNYWRSTVLQAVAAELLAGADKKLAADYFLIGLLADIGRLALLSILKQDYVELAARARNQKLSLHELEEQTYGFSHVTVSCRLAKEWGLPDSVVDAIRTQHRCVSDLLDDELEAQNAVAPVASMIADMFLGTAIPNVAVTVASITGRFFNTSTEELLENTSIRIKTLGHVFDVDTESLPPVVEIMANANRQLAVLLTQKNSLETRLRNSGPIETGGSLGPAASDGKAPVLTREEFDTCANAYLEKCVERGCLPGMLLIQCHSTDACHSSTDEDIFVRSVREIAQNNLRGCDLVTRLDSHYICVLCSLSQSQDLNEIAERLQKAILRVHSREASIPISIGGIAIAAGFENSISQLQQMAFFRLDSARQNLATGIDVAVFPAPKAVTSTEQNVLVGG